MFLSCQSRNAQDDSAYSTSAGLEDTRISCEQLLHGDKVIILDLDMTLVYTSASFWPGYNARFQVTLVRNCQTRKVPLYVSFRPHLFEFLEKIYNCGYSPILWTHGAREYAEQVLDFIEQRERKSKKNTFKFEMRFYRNDCEENGQKDISKLPISAKNIVILDDQQNMFGKYSNRVINIAQYNGSRDDSELVRIGKLIEQIASAESIDKGLAEIGLNL